MEEPVKKKKRTFKKKEPPAQETKPQTEEIKDFVEQSPLDIKAHKIVNQCRKNYIRANKDDIHITFRQWEKIFELYSQVPGVIKGVPRKSNKNGEVIIGVTIYGSPIYVTQS